MCKKCKARRVFDGGVPFEEAQSYSHKARPFNTSLAQASRHRGGEAIKKKHEERKHGTNVMYKSGCRCDECRLYKREQGAAYRARREIAS